MIDASLVPQAFWGEMRFRGEWREYVVTGDEDLLCLGEHEGVRIVRVGELAGEE